MRTQGHCVAHLYPQRRYLKPCSRIAAAAATAGAAKGTARGSPRGMWFQTWDLFHRHMMTRRTWISRDAT